MQNKLLYAPSELHSIFCQGKTICGRYYSNRLSVLPNELIVRIALIISVRNNSQGA